MALSKVLYYITQNYGAPGDRIDADQSDHGLV
jgi:hypothetical protein